MQIEQIEGTVEVVSGAVSQLSQQPPCYPITHKFESDLENIDMHQISLVIGKCSNVQLDKTREEIAEANVFETPPARKRTFASTAVVFSWPNHTTAAMIIIPQHINDGAFERYIQYNDDYVSQVVVAMSVTSGLEQRPDPKQGAKRLLEYLVKHHTNLFMQIGKDRKHAVSKPMNALELAAMIVDRLLKY